MDSPNAVASLRMPWMYLLMSVIVVLRPRFGGNGGKLLFAISTKSLYPSTSLAMAHMNPESSRAMAVTILVFSFPLAISLRNLPQSLT